MKTAQQGNYKAIQENNILLIDMKGPFCEIVIKRYKEEMIELCDNLQQSHWGSVITYYGNNVFSPEDEQLLIELTRYREESNMIANATVIINSNNADLQQMQLRRIYQATNITFHVFSDINSAKEWLADYLALPHIQPSAQKNINKYIANS
tara:strand:- start:628 stop:1080 length:453 start_codon:yes stop_codon:yes gene_type:complete